MYTHTYIHILSSCFLQDTKFNKGGANIDLDLGLNLRGLKIYSSHKFINHVLYNEDPPFNQFQNERG